MCKKVPGPLGDIYTPPPLKFQKRPATCNYNSSQFIIVYLPENQNNNIHFTSKFWIFSSAFTVPKKIQNNLRNLRNSRNIRPP